MGVLFNKKTAAVSNRRTPLAMRSCKVNEKSQIWKYTECIFCTYVWQSKAEELLQATGQSFYRDQIQPSHHVYSVDRIPGRIIFSEISKKY